jgi:hypothetical protein
MEKKGEITVIGTIFRGIGLGYYPSVIQIEGTVVEKHTVIVFLCFVFTVKVERYK